MTEMVDRVARALFEAEYSGGETDEYRWERSADTYRDQARAAIEAMRAPVIDAFCTTPGSDIDDFNEFFDAAKA